MKDQKYVRTARKEDNKDICELFKSVPMKGEIQMVADRTPNFFSLYEIQKVKSETWIYKKDKLHGIGNLSVREGYLEKTHQNVGYLSDLRSNGFNREAVLFPALFAKHFMDFSAQNKCKYYLTSILSSNKAAIRALTKKRKARNGQPIFNHYRDYDLLSLHYLRKPRCDHNYEVRKANESDIINITKFLDADHKSRAFGYRFDQGEFEHRLVKWPDFKIENTYLVLHKSEIIGLTSAWDGSSVRRYRLNLISKKMRFLRKAINFYCKIFGGSGIPKENEGFKTLYLCNLSIKDNNPHVLRALLQEIYKDSYKKGFHVMTFPNFTNDNLRDTLKGFFSRNNKFSLYVVSDKELTENELPSGTPGLEIAVA